jgi:hypothetical protein
MAWYGSYIDPTLPLKLNERRLLHKAAWKKWYQNKANCTLYGVGLATSITIFIFLPDIIEGLVGLTHWSVTVTAFTIYLAMLVGLYLIMPHFRFAPCVYAELRKQGFDVCLKCGYWLKDLDNTIKNCPECGNQRIQLNA